jgi:glutamyl-tRNA synthetase
MDEQNSPVRVRFAPSPTGHFHIGGARTALFNWLYARHCAGTFILRIEDTDRSRSSDEFLHALLDGLRWLGLDWDEGPDVGGPCGPYRQSERGAIYDGYRHRLLDAGHAYERDGAVWFRVSSEPVRILDAVHGPVLRREEKDFVIVRSDGSPSFHFANVVDDLSMGISHVIRGEDHLSNSSKHVELYRALGAEPPRFAHIPLILKTSGPGKMSKRETGSLVDEYRARHFLSGALRNYLCLLGWSPKDDREILPLADIIQCFDLAGINRSNARFDEKKLAHVNREYLRRLPREEFLAHALPVLREGMGPERIGDGAYAASVLAICQEKVRGLEELPDFCGHFFLAVPCWEEGLRAKVLEESALRLEEFLAAVEGDCPFTPAGLESLVVELARAGGHGTGDYVHPLRFACSGQSVGPGLYALLATLGRERVLLRLRRFLGREIQDLDP